MVVAVNSSQLLALPGWDGPRLQSRICTHPKVQALLVQMAFGRTNGSAVLRTPQLRLQKAGDTETHKLREEIRNQVKVALSQCPQAPCCALEEE